jgi:para-aminobenzoate synthetase/4-amino-4-deoxychorismate lyase
MCFSVPIRTIYLKKYEEIYRAKMGIGGAIVADSSAESEYEESLLKAKFLTNEYKDFDLIETFLFTRSEPEKAQYQNLDLHLKRLEQSADYFDFSFDLSEIQKNLEQHAQWLKKPSYCETDYRVRLLLSSKGHVSITSTKIRLDTDKIINITVSDKRVQSDNILLFHKVTAREFFHKALLKAKDQGCEEVIFLNEKNHLTEGSFSNIFLEVKGKLFTPKKTSGLLNGILRQQLISSGAAHEKDLKLEDLKSADKIFIGNSLRGLVAAKLIN